MWISIQILQQINWFSTQNNFFNQVCICITIDTAEMQLVILKSSVLGKMWGI